MQRLEEAVEHGDVELGLIVTHVVLPSSFIGDHCYTFNKCQDVMTICKCFGYPYLFMTVICNHNWSEIKQYIDNKGF